MKTILILMLLSLAGCASIDPHSSRPRQVLALPAANPSCVLICYIRVEVNTDDDERSEEDAP